MGGNVRLLENSIGIFGYEDRPPDKNLSPFAKALTVMIITDLSKIEGLKIVERIKLQALAAELRLAASGLMKDKTAPRLGRLAQAETLVAGIVEGAGVTAVTSIASTPKGKVIGSFSAQKPQDRFFELEKEIVREIVKVLALRHSAPGTEPERYHTRSLKAFMAFGQGFLYFDAEDFASAARQFEMALAEDPDFALARQALESCPAPEALTSKMGLPEAQLARMELMMGLPNAGSACGN